MNQTAPVDVNVVVAFYSRTGRTERLALAAAVGAVQARANIRLRRLPEIASEAEIAGVPGWRESLDRLTAEYVVPRDADAAWADAFILGVPFSFEASSAQLKSYFDWLEIHRRAGRLEGKLGGAFYASASGENAREWVALNARIAQAGLTLVPLRDSSQPDTAAGSPEADAIRAYGRRIAETARAVKQSRQS